MKKIETKIEAIFDRFYEEIIAVSGLVTLAKRIVALSKADYSVSEIANLLLYTESNVERVLALTYVKRKPRGSILLQYFHGNVGALENNVSRFLLMY